MNDVETDRPYWGSQRWVPYLAVVALFLLGISLRLYDLTDPPLEAAYRQLNSAIIARGMYYQMLTTADPAIRQTAIELWHFEDKFEPPIFERIVAITYLVTGGEQIWIARIYSSLFWIIGGLALLLLARKITSWEGAIVALAFYLVLPFGVILSRRFQPDPFMVMWILVATLGLYSWEEKHDLKSAIWAGLTCAIAIVVKVFAVFFVAAGATALILSSRRLKGIWRDYQAWLIAGIMIIIPAIVYQVVRPGSQGYLTFWSTSFIGLLKQPFFYVRWYDLLNGLIGGIVIILALAGVIIATPKARALLIGLWAGYLIFGLLEPWQIHTHDYYSLILVPIVALSLAPIAAAFFTRLNAQHGIWKLMFAVVTVLALAIPSWNVRLELNLKDSRINWAAWTNIGKMIPKDGSMIALTDDYGTYIEYFGWRTVNLWPTTQDLSLVAARGGNTETNIEKNFAQQTKGMDYFLVTALYELNNQPDLKTYLYDHYAYTTGDGYILFNLKSASTNP